MSKLGHIFPFVVLIRGSNAVTTRPTFQTNVRGKHSVVKQTSIYNKESCDPISKVCTFPQFLLSDTFLASIILFSTKLSALKVKHIHSSFCLYHTSGAVKTPLKLTTKLFFYLNGSKLGPKQWKYIVNTDFKACYFLQTMLYLFWKQESVKHMLVIVFLFTYSMYK